VLSGVNLKGAYILVHINSFRLGQTNSEYYIVWSRCVMVCGYVIVQMKRVLFLLVVKIENIVMCDQVLKAGKVCVSVYQP